MMFPGLSQAIRGIGGGYEIQRILGAVGTTVYVVAAPAFMAFGTIKEVTLTEFALAFPAGLAACITATAGAIAIKDRNVASAKVKEASSNSEGTVP